MIFSPWLSLILHCSICPPCPTQTPRPPGTFHVRSGTWNFTRIILLCLNFWNVTWHESTAKPPKELNYLWTAWRRVCDVLLRYISQNQGTVYNVLYRVVIPYSLYKNLSKERKKLDSKQFFTSLDKMLTFADIYFLFSSSYFYASFRLH